ncbi:hypothetical protein OCU04_009619 [Sclerotinia nivalis]|uniref:Uncharacterized protein n=1 Tax=Sclerotinia nivalis TaxID=352851 RepID=A0A9X0AFG0_9HELO|nr:hypothetical protein OCU04_009619 [Sclerotinia nivalis]
MGMSEFGRETLVGASPNTNHIYTKSAFAKISYSRFYTGTIANNGLFQDLLGIIRIDINITMNREQEHLILRPKISDFRILLLKPTRSGRRLGNYPMTAKSILKNLTINQTL